MGMVPQLMSLHPMTTLLGGDTLSLSDNVSISQESRLACHTWIKENDTKIDPKRLAAMNEKIRLLQEKGAA